MIGTRPEIVRVAAIVRLLGPQARLINTRQHGDEMLSGVFLAAARLPEPKSLSGICGQPRHVQIGTMLDRLGSMFAERSPAAIVVQGDTNTVCAAAQARNYSRVPVVHVEVGLRSFDRAMPGEIDRCDTDLHCAPTERAVVNLRRDGVPPGKIALTGNTVVEATVDMLPDHAAAREIFAGLGVEPCHYVLATIHRPENTDDPQRLRTTLDELGKLGLEVLLPTIGELGRKLISDEGLSERLAAIRCPFGDGKASERIVTLLQAYLH